MYKFITKNFDDEVINRQTQTLIFSKGEKILRPYDETKYLHEIIEGLVKIYSYDAKSKEKIGVIYGPGDLFPLAWMIDKHRPAVYFQAISKCKVQLINLKFFQAEINNRAELSRQFVQRVVEQFALYATTVNNLGFKRGQERLAYLLLVLSSRFGKKKGEFIIIPRITHYDLGAIINLTREGVSKEFTKLEELSIIETSSSTMIIKSPKKLSQIIGKDIPIIFFDSI